MDSICFQLCDGLAQCDPEAVDTIVIAGMGGDTICGILDRAEWCMDKKYNLILQPMTHAEVLRYWLIYNEFEIEREDLVEDSGLIYPILLARFGGHTVLNDAELFVGKCAMLHEHPLFSAFLAQQILRFEKMRDGLMKSVDNTCSVRISLIQTILLQLEEMDHQ